MTDEIARSMQDYDGPVVMSITSEVGETRIALCQNGHWVAFSGDVLDRIVQGRKDFETMTSLEPRLAVARAGGQQ